MKLLVTVGSGRFDQLIQACDEQLTPHKWQVHCQIGKGGYRPENHQYFEFSDNFSALWQDADIVICHAGVATVFELLEAKKKLVVVPNMKRIDPHQDDLAQFLEDQQYCVVCRDLLCLNKAIQRCISESFQPYVKEPFFMADSILRYFELPVS